MPERSLELLQQTVGRLGRRRGAFRRDSARIASHLAAASTGKIAIPL